jgi:hypothetical protein
MSNPRDQFRDDVKRALVDPWRVAEDLGLTDGAQRQAKGLITRCPCHDDRKASLSIIVGPDGTLQVTCQAGCKGATGDVFTLIAAVNRLDPRSDFPRVLERAAQIAGMKMPEAPNGRSSGARAPAAPRPQFATPSTGVRAPAPAQPAAPAPSLDDAWEAMPAVDADTWEYLHGRGLADAADLCRSPTGSTPGAIGRYAAAGLRLAVPLRDVAGRVVAIQVRSISDDKAFRLEGPSGAGVFGDPRQLATATAVVVAEGLTDYLAAAVALRNTPEVCALGIAGVKAAAALEALPLIGKRVVLAMDADPAGDECAAKLAALLVGTGAKCFRARPSGAKDLCEMLNRGRDLVAFFREAKQLRRSTRPNVLEGTIHDDLAGEREERLAERAGKMTFGVKFLDAALNGIRPGDLIIVGAKTGIGKTELCTSIATHNALVGKRIAMFPLEAERREIGRRIKYRMLCLLIYANSVAGARDRMNYMDWRDGELDSLTGPFEQQADDLIGKKFASNLHLFYRNGSFTADDFIDIASDVVGDFDMFMLDHLHYVDSDDPNENRGVKMIVQKISDFALRTGKPVVVAAHIRKADRTEKRMLPTIEDFHGTSDVPKISTKAVMLAQAFDRPSAQGYLSPTYMAAVKCRRDGTRTRHVGLVDYDFRKGTYIEDFRLGREVKAGKEIDLLVEKEWPAWASRDWLAEVRKAGNLF